MGQAIHLSSPRTTLSRVLALLFSLTCYHRTCVITDELAVSIGSHTHKNKFLRSAPLQSGTLVKWIKNIAERFRTIKFQERFFVVSSTFQRVVLGPAKISRASYRAPRHVFRRVFPESRIRVSESFDCSTSEKKKPKTRSSLQHRESKKNLRGICTQRFLRPE